MRIPLRLLILLALVSNDADAQGTWPTREVRIIIGFSAGGTTDIITRTLAPELTRLWGQPIVIENRTGAGGDRKSTRLNSSHLRLSRMPSSA